MENNEFKKVRIINPTCYYFDDQILSNIISILLDLIKWMDLLEFMMELDI